MHAELSIHQNPSLPASHMLDALPLPACILDDRLAVRHENAAFNALRRGLRLPLKNIRIGFAPTVLTRMQDAIATGRLYKDTTDLPGLGRCSVARCGAQWLLTVLPDRGISAIAAPLENHDVLQAIFDTSLVEISLLRAVRSAGGALLDFEIIFANGELERETGRTDLVGKFYAAEYPGIRQAGVFDAMRRVVDTGKPERLEYFYPYEGFNKWFSCSFVKMGDGLVATNLDVTQHKAAEEERSKNFALLAHSERVAEFGSWEYDLMSGKFSWSDGMYRIFKLHEGEAIEPDLYVRHACKADRKAAARLAQAIVEGKADISETLNIRAGSKKKTVLVKAKLLRSEKGWPVKLLGVDMDITKARKTQEQVDKLEKQQHHQVFRLTVNTQEAERRRLSENLHNGLGQLLYAIKIGLARLIGKKTLLDPDVLAPVTAQLEELVGNAIQETRRIAHELVPSALEDHGLFYAAEKICEQLNGSTKFTCRFSGDDEKISEFLALAVFRMLQELVTNVVKHATASQAEVRIDINEDRLQIRVNDNGKGISTDLSREGIGLKSIAGKVRLLSGSLKIVCPDRGGTRVVVRLPVGKMPR